MKKILVCDDDFIMIKLLEDKIKSSGYEVYIAQDGSKALELLENNEFDLMVTDMHMPHVTGMELIDFVRNDLKKKLPIIVLTKDSSENTTEDAYQVGADDYMLKPVNMNVLLIKIKKLLQE